MNEASFKDHPREQKQTCLVSVFADSLYNAIGHFTVKRRLQQYENWLSNNAVSADMQTELHAGHLAAERYCGSTWDKGCFSPSCKSETRK